MKKVGIVFSLCLGLTVMGLTSCMACVCPGWTSQTLSPHHLQTYTQSLDGFLVMVVETEVNPTDEPKTLPFGSSQVVWALPSFNSSSCTTVSVNLGPKTMHPADVSVPPSKKAQQPFGWTWTAKASTKWTNDSSGAVEYSGWYENGFAPDWGDVTFE